MRGGLGMGAGFCTSAAAKGFVPGKGVAAAAGAAGALAAVASSRNAARAANAGLAEAESLAKKQLAYAAQASLYICIPQHLFAFRKKSVYAGRCWRRGSTETQKRRRSD